MRCDERAVQHCVNEEGGEEEDEEDESRRLLIKMGHEESSFSFSFRERRGSRTKSK